MFDSPISLQESCIDYICENISAICEVQTNLDDSSSRLMFKEQDAYFPDGISEQLLKTLCEKGKLDDATLTLFDASVTRLTRVKLNGASKVTTKGLRVLRGHKISDLEATGLNISVNDLIGCLGDWTLQNLRSLNVSHSALMNSGKICVVVSLSKLRNLHILNVSNTEFNRHGLEIIAEDLPCLEQLDISNTRVSDISPLRKCKARLKSLTMYNLKSIAYEEAAPLLCELEELRHLDISDDKRDYPFDVLPAMKYNVSSLIQQFTSLPHLTSLDISGKEEIDITQLRSFLSHHPNMKFLGLMQTDACYNEMFVDSTHSEYNSSLVITGSGTENQILESLRRYVNRPHYMQKSLYYLFRISQTFTESRVDIIKLVLPGMKAHPRQIGIQMAATACLYNLSKGEMGQKVHPYWLGQIVELTLQAMENFPHHPQLQKNTLLTLCSDRILQEVTFDRYKCARLVMDCLCAFEDPSMNRMCVAICSILAAKISTLETSLLGANPSYMKKLLGIVHAKMTEGVIDITMKFTLSALWNLTDESPGTCNVFLEEKGLELFLQVLEKFPNESAVETKVLGLVNNIAEVRNLRTALLMDNFVKSLRTLLHSVHIDVSYFAAGIIAHLASEGEQAWEAKMISRKEMLAELGLVVLAWETPEGEMVAYRSFHPFFPLLLCYEAYEVQLWAVWAIHHVCSKNPKRYCPMLMDEHGFELLRDLTESPVIHEDVLGLCCNIMHLLQAENAANEAAEMKN